MKLYSVGKFIYGLFAINPNALKFTRENVGHVIINMERAHLTRMVMPMNLFVRF
jgi:hypothetical protein